MTRDDEGGHTPSEGSEEILEEDDKVKRSKIEERERQPQGGFIAAATAVSGVLMGYQKTLEIRISLIFAPRTFRFHLKNRSRLTDMRCQSTLSMFR